MNQLLADLLKLLDVENLEHNLFRGESRDIGSSQVFGGQVLGQALAAASKTVQGRLVHSLHAYFLRRGNFSRPIVYNVERARDGSHVSTRRVTAIQDGESILNLAASFQVEEQGLEHQATAPQVPPPESLEDFALSARQWLHKVPENVRQLFSRERPFQVRETEPYDYAAPSKRAPLRSLWFRTVDRLPDDEELHRVLLAYLSDYFLLDTVLQAHALTPLSSAFVVASMDHALWFHRTLRVDQWLLFCTDSPSASGARGFARGSVFARDGRLVASVAQEGLVRASHGVNA